MPNQVILTFTASHDDPDNTDANGDVLLVGRLTAKTDHTGTLPPAIRAYRPAADAKGASKTGMAAGSAAPARLLTMHQHRPRQVPGGLAPAAEDWVRFDSSVFFVFSEATEGREDEYEKWYDEVHLQEVMEHPRIRAATRLYLDTPDWAFPRHVAAYEIVDPDPVEVVEELKRAARNPTDVINRQTAKHLICVQA